MEHKPLDKHYDVVIVGGGINGAAMANMASGLGLKTLLLEKNDFASGASSKSTKLLHGGIRYLEQWDWRLVKESLRERYELWRALPLLTRPVRFVIPVYKHDTRPLWMMKAGVRFYQWLAGKNRIGDVTYFSAKETLALIPGIDPMGLQGSVSYFDVQMDDTGIVFANIQQALSQGARVCAYTGVGSFIKDNGRTVGVCAIDRRHYKEVHVYAEHIICATGPWSNKLLSEDYGKPVTRVRPTKGVHIVYQERLADDAVFIQSRDDRRIFFVIPWGKHSLIGTTDTDFKGDPDQVQVEEEDVNYLLNQTQRVFKKKDIFEGKIVTTFAGLRPLVSAPGNPSRISRQHVIEQSDSGVWYVMGGKYTTFRVMAEDCLEKVLNQPLNYQWQFVE